MEDNVFFESITCFVDEIYVDVGIVRVDFPAAFVYRHEDRFDTRSSLCHQAGGTGRSDGQTGDVPASVFHHFLVQFRVGFFQAVDERVVLFAFGIVDFEGAAFLGHVDGGAVGRQCDGLVYLSEKSLASSVP